MRINDPMTSEQKILLGRITKIYGFEGAVTIKLEKDFSENIPESEPVFIEIDGRPVPFYIEYAEAAGPGFVRLKFEGYDLPEKMLEFAGCRVLIVSEGKMSGEDDVRLRDLAGYEILSEGRSIGRITDIIRNPGQILMEVETKSGKTMLVPLHEDLVEEWNNKLRYIKMILPEGLAGIN